MKLDNFVINDWTAELGVRQLFFDVDDTDKILPRKISIEMIGKADYHTELDDKGNIIKDHYVIIENIIFDEIDVTDLYCNGTQCYTHTNGFTDEFYGFIGVNGVVNIDFYTPLWKWFNSKCK